MSSDEILTVPEAAKLLKISTKTCYDSSARTAAGGSSSYTVPMVRGRSAVGTVGASPILSSKSGPARSAHINKA